MKKRKIIHFNLLFLSIFTLIIIGVVPFIFIIVPIIFLVGSTQYIPAAIFTNGLNLLAVLTKNITNIPITLIIGVVALCFSKPFRNIKRIEKKNILIIVILTVYSFISILWTTSPNYGLFKSFGLIMGVLIPSISISLIQSNDTKNNDEILKYILFFSVLSSIILIITNTTTLFGTRNTIAGINPIWNSRDIGVGVIIWYSFITSKPNYFNKTFMYLLFLILICGLVVNGSRGPVISVVISIFALELTKTMRSLTKKSDSIRSIILMILGFIIVSYILGSDSRFSLNFIMNDKNVYERINFFSIINENLLNAPFLGNGIGSFSTLYSGIDFRYYPHNIILEIYIELGIFGISLFSILIYNSFKTFFMNRENNLHVQIWFTIFLFYFASSLYSGDLFSNAYVFVSMITLNNIRKGDAQ